MIGFDSAEPELLDRWCNDGTLPNLKALRDRSAWGKVSYPSFLGSGAMWPSLFTGVSPAEHGATFTRKLSRTAMNNTIFHARNFKGNRSGNGSAKKANVLLLSMPRNFH